MGHARLSASQTKQWWYCPGSVAVLETRPDLASPSGEFAVLGTAAHALLETCLTTGTHPEDYLDRLIEVEGDNDENTSLLPKNAKMPKGAGRHVFVIDADMTDAVSVCYNYVLDRLHEILAVDDMADAEMLKGAIKSGVLKVETHVIPLPHRDDTGGTADIILDDWPTMLEVIDYKNGSGVLVSVEGNHQLRTYALGAAILDQFSHDYVRYTIVQPRHPDGGLKSEDISMSSLRNWAGELDVAADRVDEAREVLTKHSGDPEALFQHGYLSVGSDGSHCTFCDYKHECIAAKRKVEELAGMDFEDEPDDIEVPTSNNYLPILLPWVPFLDKWCKSVETAGQRILESGGVVEGFKLVRGRSNRKLIDKLFDEVTEETIDLSDDEDLAAVIAEDFEMGVEELFKERAIRTGPQIEKLLPKEKRAEFNNKFMFKPDGKLTIVPDSDSRDAVVINPGSDFDDEEL